MQIDPRGALYEKGPSNLILMVNDCGKCEIPHYEMLGDGPRKGCSSASKRDTHDAGLFDVLLTELQPGRCDDLPHKLDGMLESNARALRSNCRKLLSHKKPQLGFVVGYMHAQVKQKQEILALSKRVAPDVHRCVICKPGGIHASSSTCQCDARTILDEV